MVSSEYRVPETIRQVHFTNAAAAAAVYAARGWKVVPVPLGEKGPKDKDWQQKNYNLERDFDGRNVGVQFLRLVDSPTSIWIVPKQLS